MKFIKLYYCLKKFMPASFQIFLRRWIAKNKLKKYTNIWPIDRKACKRPDCFDGWPDNKQFAFLLRHDVETEAGIEKCSRLARLDKQLGFLSTFNFVPGKYFVDTELRSILMKNGFEIGVHGLKHDGKLYSSSSNFKNRSKKINHYLKEWESVGFYSPAAHHNLNWLQELNIEYDSSTFDTDPFEPQPDGVGTIFPFIVQNDNYSHYYVEIPYTLPQDFTLYILLQEKNIDIWKKKVDWIAENGGMVFLNTHPDYMQFDGEKLKLKEYYVELYIDLLKYVKMKYNNQYWNVLPKQMAEFWKSLYQSVE